MTTNPESLLAVTQELLPCPFCGGDELSHGWNYAGIQWAQVECHNDACQANVFANTEAEAIAAWNTRATPPVLEDVEAQAMKIACHAVLQSYGEGGRREAQAATLGRLWKDHPAYQAALMALATRPAPPATVNHTLWEGPPYEYGFTWGPPAQPGREEVVPKATGLKGDDVLAFLGSAFRNIDLPPLGRDDVAEIGEALDRFIARRQPAAEPLLARQDVRPSGYWGDGNTPDYVEYNTVPADFIIGHSQDVRPEAEGKVYSDIGLVAILRGHAGNCDVEGCGRLANVFRQAANRIEALSTLPTEPASVREDVEREIIAWLRLDEHRGSYKARTVADAIERGEHRSALSTEEPKL